MELGTLLGPAGAITVLAGQSQCPAYIVLGNGATAVGLRQIDVSIDGIPFISIANERLIAAFAQWQQETNAAVGAVGNMLKIATGQIRKSTNLRFVNDTVATPIIYGFSDAKDGIPIQATTKTINASSFDVFEKFSALMLDMSGGVFNTAEVVFADGHKETCQPQELAALFNLKYQSDTSTTGNLAGGDVLCIDNTDQSVKSVQINTGGTAMTVLNVKLPDASFQQLKA